MTLALAVELAPDVAVNHGPARHDRPAPRPHRPRSGPRSSPPPRSGGDGTPDDANRLILYLLEGTDFATGACLPGRRRPVPGRGWPLIPLGPAEGLRRAESGEGHRARRAQPRSSGSGSNVPPRAGPEGRPSQPSRRVA